MKRITLEELLKNKSASQYIEQYQYIQKLIDKNKIRPIKNAKKNGKSPALPLAYYVVEEQEDYSDLIEELHYGISTRISTDYYCKHPDIYKKEREWVLSLSRYLNEERNQLEAVSLNERSFQIWSREKFLQKESGNKVLKHCGLSVEDLNLYQTTEPLAYYSVNREVPQIILIIENKDTFYTMRKFLIENPKATILGIPVKTLVYGAGKGILRSVEDFAFCVEPYMNHRDNQYLYFGDLDYEGIGIYENLARLMMSEHTVTPFIEGYQIMLDKAEKCEKLPDTKEAQNRNLNGLFYSFFDDIDVRRVKLILEREQYIPQEIINISDMKRKC